MAQQPIKLPDVSSREQTHAVQPWHSEAIGGLTSARLTARWKDQGWGNQKGRVHARVATADGKVLHKWRRITGAAPHQETDLEAALPEEFFSGQAPNHVWCLASRENSGQEIKLQGDPAKVIATAQYGSFADRYADVTDIVKRELAAGNPVQASNDLFGDPCPGFQKRLELTLSQVAMATLTEEQREGMCLSCTEGDGASLLIPGNDPDLVAEAKYGLFGESELVDVREIVIRELSAGRPVKPSKELFGDAAPGKPQEIRVTLTAEAEHEYFPTISMPDDARLELGYEVGGGGGHSLTITVADLHIKKIMKVLTADLTNPAAVVITTMAGEELTKLSVGEQDSEEARDEKIREAVRAILGDAVGFAVLIAGSNHVVKSS